MQKDIQSRLSSPAMADFAAGRYVWQAAVGGAAQDGLKEPQIRKIDERTMLVAGKHKLGFTILPAPPAAPPTEPAK